MKQVFKLVGKDGPTPRKGDVSIIDEHRFPGRGKGGSKITAGVVSAVDVVNDDLNLAVVVDVGRCKASSILVVLAVVGRHRGIDG